MTLSLDDRNLTEGSSIQLVLFAARSRPWLFVVATLLFCDRDRGSLISLSSLIIHHFSYFSSYFLRFYKTHGYRELDMKIAKRSVWLASKPWFMLYFELYNANLKYS